MHEDFGEGQGVCTRMVQGLPEKGRELQALKVEHEGLPPA